MVLLRSFVPTNSHWKKVSSSSGAITLSTVTDPLNIVSFDCLKLREILHNMVDALINKLSHRRIQIDLEAGIPVWASKPGAQKSFLVNYILSSIYSDK